MTNMTLSRSKKESLFLCLLFVDGRAGLGRADGRQALAFSLSQEKPEGDLQVWTWWPVISQARSNGKRSTNNHLQWILGAE